MPRLPRARGLFACLFLSALNSGVSPLPLGELCRNGISQPLVQRGEWGGGREGAQDNMYLYCLECTLCPDSHFTFEKKSEFERVSLN